MTTHLRNTTTRSQATTIGGFHQLVNPDPNQQKPVRHCPCGTKLRRSKPGWEQLCDPCDDKRLRALADVAVEEFIPEPPIATAKHHPTATCRCGRPMWPQSRRCRLCHDEMIRQERGIVGGSDVSLVAAPNGASVARPGGTA